MEKGFLLISLGFLFAELLIEVFPVIPAAIGYVILMIGIWKVKEEGEGAKLQKQGLWASFGAIAMAGGSYLLPLLSVGEESLLFTLWGIAEDLAVIWMLRKIILWAVYHLRRQEQAALADRYQLRGDIYSAAFLMTLVGFLTSALLASKQGIWVFSLLRDALPLWMIYLLYRLPAYLAKGEKTEAAKAQAEANSVAVQNIDEDEADDGFTRGE